LGGDKSQWRALEHNHEASDSIEGWEFLDQISNYSLFKRLSFSTKHARSAVMEA
jgi:hypothetical protein